MSEHNGLRRLFVGGLHRGDRYKLYIPDDVLILALLHHILDLCMDALLEYPIKESEAEFMVDYAEARLKHLKGELSELRSIGGQSFDEVFEWVFEKVREKSREVYRILVDELYRKNIPVGCGRKGIMRLLRMFIRNKGYAGIIYVNNRPLPLAAAATKIFSMLKSGEKVRVGFTLRLGPYVYVVYRVIEASSIPEFMHKIL